MTAWDDDVGKDDYLGFVELGLAQFSNGAPVDAAFSLTTKDGKKAVGDIRLRIDFDPEIKVPNVVPTQNYNQPNYQQPNYQQPNYQQQNYQQQNQVKRFA